MHGHYRATWARHIIKDAFSRAGIEDDGRLGTHTLRKTWARKVYEASGPDILVVSAGLNHSSITITQKYLGPEEEAVMAAMMSCDFTRGPRKHTIPTADPNPKVGLKVAKVGPTRLW